MLTMLYRQFSLRRVVLLLGLVAVLGMSESWANHNHPWRHPCLPGHRVSGNLSPSRTSRLLHMNRNLLNEAIQIARHSARYFRQFISHSQLRNRHLQRECRNNALLGMPVNNSRFESWQENLNGDFHRLALLIVYVYEANLDAWDYSDRLQSLLTQLRDAACFMENTATLINRSLSRTVQPSDVPEMYRSLPDQARRDRRNCILARRVFEVLDDMLPTYS